MLEVNTESIGFILVFVPFMYSHDILTLSDPGTLPRASPREGSEKPGFPLDLLQKMNSGHIK